jgi:hypothetical protein
MGASGEPKRSKIGVKHDDDRRQENTTILKRSWIELGAAETILYKNDALRLG